MKNKSIVLTLLLFSFYSCFSQADTARKRLMDYNNKIFAIVDNCISIDKEITKAINNKNPVDIEFHRTSLLMSVEKGMKQLDKTASFDDDASLKFSGRDVLKYYKQLAESDLPQIRDFFIIENNFLLLKNKFAKKPVKKYSNAEIYAYNNEVKKYNEASIRYSQLSTFINSSRKLTLYNWNASAKIFTDAHLRNS